MRNPVRVRRTVASLVSLGGLMVLAAGCMQKPWSPQPGPVQAFNVTHARPEQDLVYTLAYPTGDRRTSALLIEQSAPEEIHVNREATFRIRVTNTTNEPVHGVAMRARPIEGMKVTGVTAPTREIGDGQVIYELGDLAPHESKTVEVTGIPERTGHVDLSYVVTSQPPQLQATFNVVNPTLKITATGPTDVDICQDIVYRYSVTNTGVGLARGVKLEMKLPEGLATADGKNMVQADLGDIPQGQSRDVTARLRASRTARFTTQAFVQSRDESAQAEALSTATHAPNLIIAMKGPEQDYVGHPVTYQVIVKNNGDAPARGAVLRVGSSDIGQVMAVRTEEPAAGEAQMAAAGAQDSDSASLGTLEPGQSREVEVTAQAVQGGTLAVSAVASAGCAKEVRDSAATKIMTAPSLLVQAFDETDPVKVGQNVAYTVRVVNQGTGPDTNVRMTATVPDGMELVSASGATAGRTSGNTVEFAPVARLAPGEAATWTVIARALRAGDVQFKASAVSDTIKAPAVKLEPTKLQ